MGLSQRTIDEMKAGMKQVAAHSGNGDVSDDYMDAMIRTGVRAKWLRDREREGRLRIEKVMRAATNTKTPGEVPVYIVYIGQEQFADDNACLTGCWPSEVLMAHVALALGAGIGKEEV